MSRTILPIWKEAPFLRIIIPFITGILSSWYLGINIFLSWSIFFSCIFVLSFFEFSKIFIQFKYNWAKGIILNVVFFCLGLLLTSYSSYSNTKGGSYYVYKKDDIIMVRLEEPLNEKAKSFKVITSIQSIVRKNSCLAGRGKVLLYLQKDSIAPSLGYGSILIFNQSLQPIRNTGNPGEFDYTRYCNFQHICYQAYLQTKEYVVSPFPKENIFKKYLFITQHKLTAILQTFLAGRKETGLAEALLIGYKDDLDKTLIQSYTHTGVVHIIAISGLHLALIYSVLQFLLSPFEKNKTSRWINPVLLIISLWLFSFLSGASPSVLRSAVMFTFIIIGKYFSKSSSIFNSLGASAFFLLCYNPCWLWDIGFQLSYAAVLSIVLYMQPVYNLFFVQNKLLDLVWKSASVTIAAQILTVPISVYYFHQFPTYFLVTNLLAVPLSSLILLGEILLCTMAFIPALAKIIGICLSWMVWVLNHFIEHMERLPLSLWNHLYIDLFQCFSIYIAIAFISCWTKKKKKVFLFSALATLISFVLARTISFVKANKQTMLLIYNIPRHQAIDFVEGRKYRFICDSGLLANDLLQNLYLYPARVKYRISPIQANDPKNSYAIFQLKSKRIIVMDQSVAFAPLSSRIDADIIIVSRNPEISILNMASVFNCRQWVFDGSNSGWKIKKWEKECKQLALSYYTIPEKGAFVMNMD